MDGQLPLRLEVDLMNLGVLPRSPLDQVEDPEEPRIPRRFEFNMPNLDEYGEPNF